MKISDHFSLEEFCFSQTAVRAGIRNEPNEETITRIKEVAKQLEFIRNTLNELPIRISSGYRCTALNRAIGSKDSSHHVTGYAVDFTCPAYGTPKEVCEKILAAGYKFDQLILEGVSKTNPEGAWVHISFNPTLRGEVLTMSSIGGIQSYIKGLPRE
jgi:hypothetical protein